MIDRNDVRQIIEGLIPYLAKTDAAKEAEISKARSSGRRKRQEPFERDATPDLIQWLQNKAVATVHKLTSQTKEGEPGGYVGPTPGRKLPTWGDVFSKGQRGKVINAPDPAAPAPADWKSSHERRTNAPFGGMAGGGKKPDDSGPEFLGGDTYPVHPPPKIPSSNQVPLPKGRRSPGSSLPAAAQPNAADPADKPFLPQPQAPKGPQAGAAGYPTGGQKSIEDMGKEFGKAFAPDNYRSSEETGRHMVRGTQKAADALGIGQVAKPFTQLADTVLYSIDKLKDWSKKLHEANMQFAEWSSAMAGVKARQEVRELQLSQERGDRRAASAETLAKGENALNQATAPMEDLFGNLENTIVGSIDQVIAGMIEGLNWVLFIKTANDLIAWLNRGDDTNKPGNMNEYADKQAHFWDQAGRPDRFGE